MKYMLAAAAVYATALLGSACALDSESEVLDDDVVEDGKADVSAGPDATRAAAALQRARQAFASNDDQTLVAAVRDVLRNEGNALRPRAAEALQLLESAYERNATGNLAIAPNVPAAFGELRVHFRTYTRMDYVDGSNFHWPRLFTHAVWVDGPASLPIASIRLARHQTGQEDLVYVDTAAGVGAPTTPLDPVPSSSQRKVLGIARVRVGGFPGPMTETDSRWQQTRAVYSLKVVLTTGARLDTFFIVTNAHSTEIPEVISPATVEIVNTQTPTIRLGRLSSSQLRPFETSELLLYVIQDRDIGNAVGDRPGERVVWRKRIANPVAGLSVPLSQAPFDGTAVLVDDKFHKQLTTVSESRRFGGLVISRDYALETPFRVEAQ